MKEVRIKRAALIEILQKNRDGHRALFEKAQAGYKAQLIKILENRLDEARKGRHVEQFINLPEPTDQTRDYDRVLRMLELSVDDDITLSNSEFAQYVQDDWTWKQQFVSTSNSYINA